ncbi:MAG: SIMPL domain-containing protein, partial [Novosphingobium sp.]|nr:SIMPL domain-containing protein [Novosphingobium sp.]
MNRNPLASICAALAAAFLAQPAAAQQAGPLPPIAPGNTLLTVSAEGRTTHAPELAVFSAGVTTQGTTAGEALGANSTAMARVIAELKRAGIAERDIQTSNLAVNPVYSNPVREASGEERVPRIVGYRATNTVSVRQRKLGDFGKVIDTLVAAGANEVNGPNFQLDDQDPALD